MSQVRHFILGAAGHVDHGKTALVSALTGTNTDRLKEEQERGISIELGFAEFKLDENLLLGVVDMPGHERFVKQMVSGAGGVDLAFLVVASDEGVMPQTIEHLEILNTLGVPSGVVVMTKTDLVDEEILAVATEEVMELVVGTFLEDKPIVPVSAIAGTGLDELKAALKELALALPVRREDGPFRLPIDRVFSLPGIGVIATGTCWSGRITEGDRLTVSPTGQPVRIREVQVHGRRADHGASGQRLALALHGVKKDDLQRGFQLVTPDSAMLTRRLDIRIDLMPHYGGILRNRQRLHIHHAGREVLGRVVLLDEQELGGQGARTGVAQLHLEDELVAVRGDKLVLRFYSPVTTIAGGTVLNPVAERHKRFEEGALEVLAVMEDGDPVELFRQNLQEAGLAGLPLSEAMGQQDDEQALAIGKRLYHRGLLDELMNKVSELITEYARRFPLRLGIPREEARRKCKFKGGVAEWNALCLALAADGRWHLIGDRIGLTNSGPELSPAMAKAINQLVAEVANVKMLWPGNENFARESAVFRAAATDPQLKDFVPQEVYRYLTDHDLAVQINSEYLVHKQSLQELIKSLRGTLTAEKEITFAGFRELSGLSRKLGIPVLEYFDSIGLTVRDGDVRRAGSEFDVLCKDGDSNG